MPTDSSPCSDDCATPQAAPGCSYWILSVALWFVWAVVLPAQTMLVIALFDLASDGTAEFIVSASLALGITAVMYEQRARTLGQPWALSRAFDFGTHAIVASAFVSVAWFVWGNLKIGYDDHANPVPAQTLGLIAGVILVRGAWRLVRRSSR